LPDDGFSRRGRPASAVAFPITSLPTREKQGHADRDPDLWQAAPEHPVPEVPDGVANAYLLVRPAGNVLFHGTGREAIGAGDDAGELRHIEELGGITYQLLAHRHEAAASLERIEQRFGATLVCHEDDAEGVRG
jgi:hypothetical protein